MASFMMVDPSRPVVVVTGLRGSVPAEAAAKGVVVFNTPGDHDWRVPSGVTRLFVEVVGGGGGGSGGKVASFNGGGGGGGGGYGAAKLTVVPGTVAEVTVGAGGKAGTAGDGAEPDNGIDSVFVHDVTEVYGGRGLKAIDNAGGAGGSTSGNATTVMHAGGQGASGAAALGGGGGGGAGRMVVGGDAVGVTGGAGDPPGGDGGLGGTGAAGGAGSIYAGGGGGGGTAGGDKAGGAGAPGYVRIQWPPPA